MKINHPISVNEWIEHRREIWNFTSEINKARKQHDYIIIKAPVKSGKKEIVFAQALSDQHDEKIKHIYVSSFYRKEIENQLNEYDSYGVDVLLTNTGKSTQEAVKKINLIISKFEKVIIHFDESDFGTDKDGMLNKIFSLTLQKNNVHMRFYSATNEEAVNSKFKESCAAHILQFQPPENYRGAEFFLNNHLVHQPEPFFEINFGVASITSHGQEIIDNFLTSEKCLGIVRLVGKDSNKPNDPLFETIKKDKKINEYFSKNGILCEYVDSNNNFDWETRPENYNNLFESSNKKNRTIIFLNQKAVRSTEIFCHKYIDFWHDYRSADTTYATLNQAALRVCHYKEQGQPENMIKVYADINIFKKAADLINDKEFCTISERSLSSRISSKLQKKKYKFYSTIEEVPLKYTEYYQAGKAQANCSANNGVDIAGCILENKSHTYSVVYLDGPNQKHQSSWDKLVNQIPDIKNKFAVFEECELTPDNITTETSRHSMYANL